MRKRICCWLWTLAVMACLFRPGNVMAAAPLEVAQPCSLTLSYAQEGTGFPGLEIRVYRVAEAFSDGTFELISPFSGYPVNIHGITSQAEWKTAAATLRAYIAADGVQPTRTETTDSSGAAAFTDLETGLYLVSGAVAEQNDGTYLFDDFMVYLPTPQADGSFCYEVEARPKCARHTPAAAYQVVKLWKDAGNAANRPASITVDLLEDGILRETQVLNAGNNWTYAWQDPDGAGVWTVVEREVPKDYTVTIQRHETTFMITNTHTLPEDRPQTGDTAPLWAYVAAMCLSGFLLLILGLRGKGGRKHG